MAQRKGKSISAVISGVFVGIAAGAVLGVLASLIFDNWYFTAVTIMSGAIIGFIFSLTNREMR